ncbi:MAG: SPASM domain-containing protein [Alphaproteobacteria bacterium]|nr:SPASM domain-containing protein [Alphaproteobacteria bacterium]
MSRVYRTSRYNLAVPTADGGALLYNAASGAVVSFPGSAGVEIAENLVRWPARIDPEGVAPSIVSRLVAAGILRPEGAGDELLAIRQRYWEARGRTPMTLTVTTTQDCNLGCWYCYEDRTEDALQEHDVDAIVAETRRRLVAGGRSALHVDWYGGEPMLNQEFLRSCSERLQAMARELGIAYAASMISNGSSWPNDPAGFAKAHQLRQVQISFDGMRSRHNRVRRLRSGYRTSRGASPFDEAVSVVDALLEVTQVDVRLNLTPANVEDVGPFLDMVEERRWLDRPGRCTIQPARVTRFSQRSDFVRRNELSPEAFEAVLDRVRERCRKPEAVVTAWFQDGLGPKRSVCAALAADSFVVGAEALVYRCGLQVGERERAVETLRGGPEADAPFEDRAFWEGFDPTRMPDCRRCTFLPICWGGCPKKHLEGDRQSLDNTSEFYRRNLPHRIAAGSRAEVAAGFRFGEEDQFKAD